MEIGMLSGLAQDLGYDKRIEDAKYFEQQRKQREAMDMAKAAMLADDLEFASGSNPYDAARIKQYSYDKFNELKSLADTNRNWATDPMLRAQIAYKKHELKTGAPILQSLAFANAKKQFAETLLDAEKNPGAYDKDELDEINRQMQTYSNFDPTKEQPAFVYNPPTKYRELDDLLKFADKVEPDQLVPINNGRIGANKQVLSEKRLDELAKAAYYENPDQYKRYVKQGIDPIEGAIKPALRTRVKPKFFEGYEDKVGDAMKIEGYKAMLKRRGEMLNQGKVDQIFDNEILKTDDRPIEADEFSATFTSNPTVTYAGPDGKPITEAGARFYANKIADANPDKKDGLKVVDGFIIKPIEFGEELDVVEREGIFGRGKYVVKPEHRHAYEIIYPEPNAQGEAKPYLQVKARTQVNANSQEAKSRYNSYIKLTTKNRDAQLEQPSVGEVREYKEDADGNRYYKGIDY